MSSADFPLLLPPAPPHAGNMVKGKEKSNVSLRRDPSWKYSVQVDVGGKRKVGIIEDDEDLNFIDTIGEEDSLEDPFSDGT
ncbi:hypothetical protein M5K25_018265 [Dendrobium thyrsiflorum]|uniref:Uncharacterized protein n=1 Tax=Dendrobium thyrsiflorum TaxID=117978 RepID=A0ABD0UI98_DENTH